MPSETLRRLIYRSHAAAGFGLAELLAMMTKARENNAVRRVTGLLVHQHGLFLQALEGPAVEVEDLWQVIRRDSRHEGVVLLGERDVPSRWFGDWSMELANGDHLPGRYAGVWTIALAIPLAGVGNLLDAEAVLRGFADTPD
ncbi:MAG: BLUF domain-containing protein [Silanimonas sp.]